ncbi:MAG: phosphatidate cytidylyltransferase [Clostridia bacterium]|nr:phosphatidate cytidylyltransferase [Clostridia bacterium]
MKQRIITGLIATCVLIPVLIFSDTPALPIGIALCSVIGMFEMVRCIGLQKAYVLNIPLYLLAAGLPFLVRYAGKPNTDATDALLLKYMMVISLAVILYFFAVMTFSHGKYKVADVCILFAVAFYILMGFNGILVLRIHRYQGHLAYLTVFLGAWITDIFAYFCGILFGRGGKHKLIPDVSPKKTVEGSVGGILFCVLTMIGFGLICNHLLNEQASLWIFAIGGLIASIVSQVGDLVMSVIKRTYGIKDYGKIFPGHGGMLDRFDSIIAVSVALVAFTSFFDFFAR